MITKATPQSPQNFHRGLKALLALIFAGTLCFALYGAVQAQDGAPIINETGLPISPITNTIPTISVQNPAPTYILSNNLDPIYNQVLNGVSSSSLSLPPGDYNLVSIPETAFSPPFDPIPFPYDRHPYDIGCIGNKIITVKSTTH
ncbi:MAG TPA: hypothetical protein VMG59_00500 [Phycisphaerae bacterium]|nr:hypothetical protein [Phycisphaerae bacterium]